jgi:hypothetical protein
MEIEMNNVAVYNPRTSALATDIKTRYSGKTLVVMVPEDQKSTFAQELKDLLSDRSDILVTDDIRVKALNFLNNASLPASISLLEAATLGRTEAFKNNETVVIVAIDSEFAQHKFGSHVLDRALALRLS